MGCILKSESYHSVYAGDRAMKEYYSIGETAHLLGVTTTTLRYYEKIGILKPKKISEESGYRWYTYDQFHIIDRIKYLQSLGLNLVDIGEIIKDGTVDSMLHALEAEWRNAHEELEKVRNRIKDIEWYIDCFTYMRRTSNMESWYHLYLPERHIIQVPCYDTDELADMEIRLAETKGTPRLRSLPYRRQYGYILSAADFFAQSFKPSSYFTYITERPQDYVSEYKVLPAGEYFCFRTPLLKECWDAEALKKCFPGNAFPTLIVALEFEENLTDWSNAPYEVQIYIS